MQQGAANAENHMPLGICTESHPGKDCLQHMRNERNKLILQIERLTKLDIPNLQIESDGRKYESDLFEKRWNDAEDKLKESNRLISAFKEIIEECAMTAFLEARKIRLPGATDGFASDVRAAVLAKAAELMTPTEKR